MRDLAWLHGLSSGAARFASRALGCASVRDIDVEAATAAWPYREGDAERFRRCAGLVSPAVIARPG
jgi:hypothetical protein